MASPTQSSPLDLAPPKPWRRLIPRWLRSLIWVDSAAHYDAFLSYSWQSDREVAPLIQSVIQKFVCPWYKVRAKTVFRDLSCLPAGSSFKDEIFARLDRSPHLIVLACPEAAGSRGMEMEAEHWFSRPRDGQVLIIITAGEFGTWDGIRDHLLPEAVRNNLRTTPLWADVRQRREEILANPDDQTLRATLIEDLRQVFLRLYPGHTWEELQGEERSQRHRLIGILSGIALLFLVLATVAFLFARYAQQQKKVAVANATDARNQKDNAVKSAIEAKRQEGIAKQEKIAADANAEEAKTQRDMAVRNAIEAKRQEGIAKEETAEAEHQSRIANSGRLAATALAHKEDQA
jgi:hypothetical protein